MLPEGGLAAGGGSRASAAFGVAFALSLVLNAVLLVGSPSAASKAAGVPSGAFRAAGAEVTCMRDVKQSGTGDIYSACTCEEIGDPKKRPLGPMTGRATSSFYPFGNSSLKSVWDTEAMLHGVLVPLKAFRKKVALIVNTASN